MVIHYNLKTIVIGSGIRYRVELGPWVLGELLCFTDCDTNGRTHHNGACRFFGSQVVDGALVTICHDYTSRKAFEAVVKTGGK